MQKDLANQLDMALASRMSELLGAPGAGPREVEECLGVAYTWLRTCGLEVWLGGGAWAHKAWKGRHNSALTSRLLSPSLLPALTAPQLVFTLFLCGLHRRIPMQIHLNSQGQVVSAALSSSTVHCSAGLSPAGPALLQAGRGGGRAEREGDGRGLPRPPHLSYPTGDQARGRETGQLPALFSSSSG